MSENYIPCKYCGAQPIKSMTSDGLVLTCPNCNDEVSVPLELIKENVDHPETAIIENFRRLSTAKKEAALKWKDLNKQSEDYKVTRRDYFAAHIASRILSRENLSETPKELGRTIAIYVDGILEGLDKYQ
jgi:hypothetical protein